MTDDAERAGAIVEAPQHRRGREGPFDESLIAVDVGSEEVQSIPDDRIVVVMDIKVLFEI